LCTINKQRRQGSNKYFEALGVAKETGYADQEVAVELKQLGGIAFTVASVFRHVLHVEHEHAAANPATNGGKLVVGKINLAGRMEQGEDPLELPISVGESFRCGLAGPTNNQERIMSHAAQFLGDLVGRQDEINGASGDGVPRHTAKASC